MTDADMKLLFVFSIISVVFVLLYQSDKHMKKSVDLMNAASVKMASAYNNIAKLREELEELRRMLKEPRND